MTELQPTDRPSHGCVVFDRPDEHLRVIAQHLAGGLRVGRRAVALIDAVAPDELAHALDEEGVDVAQQTAHGALQVASARATYLQGGRFDPVAIVDLFSSKLHEARTAGYRGLSAAGEMTWALEGFPGAERLVEYEWTLNGTVFRSPHVSGLCTYDSRRFSADLLRDIERVHPIVVSTFRAMHQLPAHPGDGVPARPASGERRSASGA